MLGTVLGVSVLLIVTHAVAIWGGSKLSGVLKALPLVGKLF